MKKKKIYKYSLGLAVGIEQSILMPVDAKILNFRMQVTQHAGYYDAPTVTPVIWATTNATNVEPRWFILRFTGDETDIRHYDYDPTIIFGSEIYIGTDIAPNGLVYHLFEIVK